MRTGLDCMVSASGGRVAPSVFSTTFRPVEMKVPHLALFKKSLKDCDKKDKCFFCKLKKHTILKIAQNLTALQAIF